MFCPKCGSQIEDNAAFCTKCGAATGANTQNTQQGYQQPYEQPQQGYQQPYGQPQQGYNPYQQPYQPGYQPQSGYYNPPESGTLAILALVFGCLGGWLGILFAIIGLATYKDPSHRQKCVIGLVVACIWILIFIIMLASGVFWFSMFY